MDFKLSWTERAIADLAGIVRYYREDERSIEAAKKVGSAIIDRVDVLQTFPDIGPPYPRKDGVHREVICYDYQSSTGWIARNASSTSFAFGTLARIRQPWSYKSGFW